MSPVCWISRSSSRLGRTYLAEAAARSGWCRYSSPSSTHGSRRRLFTSLSDRNQRSRSAGSADERRHGELEARLAIGILDARELRRRGSRSSPAPRAPPGPAPATRSRARPAAARRPALCLIPHALEPGERLRLIARRAARRTRPTSGWRSSPRRARSSATFRHSPARASRSAGVQEAPPARRADTRATRGVSCSSVSRGSGLMARSTNRGRRHRAVEHRFPQRHPRRAARQRIGDAPAATPTGRRATSGSSTNAPYAQPPPLGST